MNRAELKQVAHGLKATRPSRVADADAHLNAARVATWEATVRSVADALALKDKPRSNFLAAAGLNHGGEP